MFLTILINFLLAINIIVCVLIILLVLMQRPKSEGLGAAFGGGMTENLFGAQTTTVLTNITRWLGGIFFALTLILSILYSQQAKRTVKSDNLQALIKQAKSVPAATVPAVPAPSASASPEAAAPAASATPAATVAAPAASPAPSAAPAASPAVTGSGGQ
jgi:preprotein translocase subunit SecG